jgi:hypothetical protein
MDKTIDDVTREELAELAEAADDLLGAARMMFWLGGHEDKEDHSFADSIDRMAAALTAIGLPQGTTAEFIASVEAMLESGMAPDQWRAMQQAAPGKPL